MWGTLQVRCCHGRGPAGRIGTVAGGRDTTHDWARNLDAGHLERIRREPTVFAPGGTLHLVLEVLAYAADEAESAGTGRAVITLSPDGSVAVADHGRGTQTRARGRGQVVRKPVMTTPDLRFFGAPRPPLLPDGHPRRGVSVVAALSEWLVHTSRRRDGAWTQRYQHGIPVTGLTPVPGAGPAGTTVSFLPDTGLVTATRVAVRDLRRLAVAFGPQLTVEIVGFPG